MGSKWIASVCFPCGGYESPPLGAMYAVVQPSRHCTPVFNYYTLVCVHTYHHRRDSGRWTLEHTKYIIITHQTQCLGKLHLLWSLSVAHSMSLLVSCGEHIVWDTERYASQCIKLHSYLPCSPFLSVWKKCQGSVKRIKVYTIWYYDVNTLLFCICHLFEIDNELREYLNWLDSKYFSQRDALNLTTLWYGNSTSC